MIGTHLITCPECGRISHNLNEVALLYCNACHMFHEEILQQKADEAVREALAWYASPQTWNQWLPDSAGEHARRALALLDRLNTIRNRVKLATMRHRVK